jgi:hypothetical protein
MMYRRSTRRLAVAAGAWLCAGAAVAQTPPDFSTVEVSAQKLTATCMRWRVSESTSDSPVRKLLGASKEGICRDVAAKWSPRYVEWSQRKDQSAQLRAYADICRDVAETMAGRSVEVPWCSTWDQIPGVPVALPAPPDEIWNALDGLPLESLAAKKARREELLHTAIVRRLSKDWDQIRVKATLEAAGLSCAVYRKEGRDYSITTATPQFTCIGNLSDTVGTASKPLLLFSRIDVSVKFDGTGSPAGWQQVEVKTHEMRTRLDVFRELRRLP